MYGPGIKAMTMKPSSDVPQPTPKESYRLFPANGSNAPINERNIVVAAEADAAYTVYASTRYV